jgi:excisionase family DNA binding protein
MTYERPAHCYCVACGKDNIVDNSSLKKNIVTTKELSEMLKINPKTLYQWAALGQIPSMKLNGALRFDIEDIMQWIRSCKKDQLPGYNSLAKLEARKGGQNR